MVPKHDFTMPAAAMAQLLARQAEAVCRYYLPAGRRQGRYWLVGDVHNTPGRSLFVRLSGSGSGKGAAGRWQDSASGEAWRSARSHPRKLRPDGFPRRGRGGAAVSRIGKE